jgi:hypothetical protein
MKEFSFQRGPPEEIFFLTSIASDYKNIEEHD